MFRTETAQVAATSDLKYNVSSNCTKQVIIELELYTDSYKQRRTEKGENSSPFLSFSAKGIKYAHRENI